MQKKKNDNVLFSDISVVKENQFQTKDAAAQRSTVQFVRNIYDKVRNATYYRAKERIKDER